MDLGDRLDPPLGVGQRLARRGVGQQLGLHRHHRRHQLERVGDPVIDFAEQRLEPLIGLDQARFGVVLGAANAFIGERMGKGLLEQTRRTRRRPILTTYSAAPAFSAATATELSSDPVT